MRTKTAGVLSLHPGLILPFAITRLCEAISAAWCTFRVEQTQEMFLLPRIWLFQHIVGT